MSQGQLIARGAARLLASHDFATLEEFVPARGMRVDVMALGSRSELWVVECKSSRADFQSDTKWRGYLDYCDRFFWAVGADFPTELLPDNTGLIVADGYGGEILRMGDETKLAHARRQATLRSFARAACLRLQRLRDPDALI
ncbi:MAG: MmcB family DNA repair protein [Pseudomonadota bacterium]